VLPAEVDGMGGTDVEVPEAEARVAAFTDYALRVYEEAGDTTRPVSWASVYLGFYDQQSRGKTIHSPRNCLPGGGWEALASQAETLEVGGESITVNRYLLQNGSQQAIVLYWYQGRGRVAHNEYLVKWDLLRDAATKRRTDEALVRIVVPIVESEEASFQFARRLAEQVKPALDEAMPL
jgi:EpsI family protein